MSRPDQISPQTTALYGIAIPTKRRSLSTQQGQTATITFQMLDYIGNPVDLTAYGNCGPQGPQFGVQGPQDCYWDVVVRVKEAIGSNTPVYQIGCTVVDETAGLVAFSLPSAITIAAGVYFAEFGVYTPDSPSLSTPNLAFTNKSYLWVDRGLFGDPRFPNQGPPSIDEIRLFIRDNGPEDNRLIDDYEFDLAEACQATENAVRYWNEVNPDVGLYFNTTNYCVRHKWLQAIAGHMMTVAAYRFRRNQLAYQAAGLSIDDQNKFQQYDQVGMMLAQEYKEWVKTKKVAINCFAAMTSTGSPYGSLAYSILNSGA